MSRIHVCSLSRLARTVEETGARHIVTLINAGTEVVRPDAVEANNHLFLAMNDINAPMAGYCAPHEDHADRLLAFVRQWSDSADTPLVIHCFAGVSRSTAGAYAAALMLRPDWEEQKLAFFMRRVSPSATPNRLIIDMCDKKLRRGGRMVKAIEAIGRGDDCFEGVPFCIDLMDAA